MAREWILFFFCVSFFDSSQAVIFAGTEIRIGPTLLAVSNSTPLTSAAFFGLSFDASHRTTRPVGKFFEHHRRLAAAAQLEEFFEDHVDAGRQAFRA